MFQLILNFAILWALVLVAGNFFRETHSRRILYLFTGVVLANIVSLSFVVLHNYGIVVEIPLVRSLLMCFPFFIGPFYYFYFCAVFGYHDAWSWNRLAHFLPAGTAFVTLAVVSYAYGSLYGDGGMRIRKIIYLFQSSHILAYYLLTALVLGRRCEKSREAKIGIILTAAYSLTFVTTSASLAFVKGDSFFKLLTAAYAYNSLVFTAHYIIAQKYPMLLALYVRGKDGVPDEITNRKTHCPIDAERLAEKLRWKMDVEKVYLVEDLNLNMLAHELGVRPYQLSYFLNTHIGSSFYSYINFHRVEEAKSMLAENPSRPVISIAFDAGFSSKSSFNRIFQNQTGMTPTEFREKSSSGQPAAPIKISGGTV